LQQNIPFSKYCVIFWQIFTQKKDFWDTLWKFNMLIAKAINSPMEVGVKFIQLDMPSTHIKQVAMASIRCAQAISSSLFLVINRRLGLAILIFYSIYVKYRTHTLVQYQKNIAIL
jgi:hypothetical protein